MATVKKTASKNTQPQYNMLTTWLVVIFTVESLVFAVVVYVNYL